ncbi:hypothetical protein MKK67_05995 [Methylobacterium sp. J-072]|uniref:hypothetical protein n=1 Tax=Methylobacterium sp. J-072 TaxID=2836651 RepID=UPI001FB97036|nr:hypothetical protein [Methylobacterium sp. J-072]MCJ2092057.1 hypothetical protein [Methylobacterium sp. J-072]
MAVGRLCGWAWLILVMVWPMSCIAGAVTSSDLPTRSMLAERAARRFPQPVRVGDLIDRPVLEPVEAQHVLGRVDAVTRDETGGIAVIVRFGGWFGLGTRRIAVPVEAVALLGEYVAVIDFTPQQLGDFPTVSPQRAQVIDSEETIRVGLTKPFH